MAAPWYARYAKGIVTFLATLTPQAVFVVLADNGVYVSGWLNLAIAVVLGTAAAVATPNRT